MNFGELVEEMYLCPEHNSIPAGVRLGPLLFASGLLPVDPCDGKVRARGLEGQVRAVLENMDAFLQTAGCTRRHVARVTFFMRDLSERLLLNPVWADWYPDPDDRPPHKYVPAVLPGGILVKLQVLALMGGERRVLEVPGLAHQDPMSMGAQIGNLVVSSRLFGVHAFTGERGQDASEHAILAFDHATTLLRQAGADWDRVNQATAFIGQQEFREVVEHQWAERIRKQDDSRLHVLETDLGGDGYPRLEIIALT